MERKSWGTKRDKDFTLRCFCVQPALCVRADLTEHSCAQELSRMLKVVLCVHLLEEAEVQSHGAWRGSTQHPVPPAGARLPPFIPPGQLE